MTLSDLQWLCEIFNDTKCRAVSLRQLSFDDDDNDDDCNYGDNEIVDTSKSLCIDDYVRFTGYILVLLNVVDVISAVSMCYPVNGQQYCFYTNGSVLNWDEARRFCSSRYSTLPIITDKDIDNVFQRFINDSVSVSGSNTEQMNNSVWLGAHAQFNNSDPWHWINGQPSGSSHALLICDAILYIFVDVCLRFCMLLTVGQIAGPIGSKLDTEIHLDPRIVLGKSRLRSRSKDKGGRAP